tara:strand:- start:2183 stop:3070 length:888 start_codon:yes stop_codon:yes gene_type:complete
MSSVANEVSAIARLFSSSVLKDLARHGESKSVANLLKQTRLPAEVGSDARLADVFDAGFSVLKRRKFRHEYIYKAALTQRVLLGTHSLKTASMMTEFRVGSCKADVVILNGTSTVYEIKSERDSLSRLERQVESYLTVFEYVNVIAGENHIEGVMDTVPEMVGVLKLSDKFQISTVREAKQDLSTLSSSAIFDAINMAEAKEILKRLSIKIPDVPNAVIYSELAHIFEGLDPIIVHSKMVEVLKRKRGLDGLSEFVSKLPSSLSSAALSVKLNKQDQLRLSDAMCVPIDQVMSWA